MTRNLLIAATAAGVLFFSLCGFALAASQQGAKERDAATAVNELASDLYKLLAGDRGNVCFSPYSISTAFAMTYAGADGDTAAEMRQAFHFGDDIHASNAILMKSIVEGPEGAGEVTVANSIWPNRGYKLSAAFEKLLKDSYGTEISTQDYEKSPEKSRLNINMWVEAKTRSRITDLIAPNMITPDTRLVLVNAIYFKAPWMNEFFKGATGEGVFKSYGEEYGVPMMNKIETVPYYEDKDFRAIKMLYRKGAFSMSILLPVEDDGISKVEERLSPGLFDKMEDEQQRHKVDIVLPKFKMESSFNLNRAISSLGASKAFDPQEADFSKINGRRDLFISDAVHKAFIEVDEDGTEAAAATAVIARTMASPDFSEPIEFRVDHPFIYAIRDEVSGAILFLGRVEDPR